MFYVNRTRTCTRETSASVLVYITRSPGGRYPIQTASRTSSTPSTGYAIARRRHYMSSSGRS